MGLGELLGLLLAVPVASCGKSFLDAWAVRLRAGELAVLEPQPASQEGGAG
jgi:predicted PurR-regulated permease PerM